MELGAEFVLESNEHFSNLRVNTSISSVQLPTNVYNKGRHHSSRGLPLSCHCVGGCEVGGGDTGVINELASVFLSSTVDYKLSPQSP